MSQNIQQVLNVSDIMRIFDISQPTVYRWIRDARAGKNTFPLPIGNGFKKKLFWSQEAISSYQNAGNAPALKIETDSQRKKRNNNALDRLRQKGVKVPAE